MVALGALGVAFGARVQAVVGSALGSRDSVACCPGETDSASTPSPKTFPQIARQSYRLQVTGLVDKPLDLTVDDLEAMPAPRW